MRHNVLGIKRKASQPTRQLAPSLKMSAGHFLNARVPHRALLNLRGVANKKAARNESA
ncbi:MAG: hypothetical protein RLZZ580_3125, partial [Cyanobacteriota bacterium]